MLKKIIFICIVLISFWVSDMFANQVCKQDWNITDIKSALTSCINWSDVIQSNDLTVASWFKDLVLKFVRNVSIILALAAIGFIAYGSMILVASWWNDEKIKKWKNIIKWSLLWFVWLVSASWIIALIVNLIYWL